MYGDQDGALDRQAGHLVGQVTRIPKAMGVVRLTAISLINYHPTRWRRTVQVRANP